MDAARPTLSIITVCLNEPYLQRTCESIVNQTFQDFEWIVIDGGSDTKTLDIFSRYRDRINYFVSEKDNGIYDGMNKGIAVANGKWLNFMNAGDSFYSSTTLAEVAPHFSDDVHGVLFGEQQYGYENKNNISYSKKKNILAQLYTSVIHHQPSFIRDTCFTNYGNYDTEYKIVSDYIYFIKLYRYGVKFLYIDNIVAIVDNNGLSYTQICKEETTKIKNLMFTKAEKNILMREENLYKITLARELLTKKRMLNLRSSK